MKKIIPLLIMILSSICSFAVELNNNETVTFSVPGNSLTSDLMIQVPASANNMRVEINNTIAGSDFDLFLKYDSDFSAPDFNGILNEANYYSAGADANEFFTINTALNFPLRSGTWYVGVYNFRAEAQDINLTVSYDSNPLSKPEIQFIFDQNTIVGSNGLPCDIDGWNDTTPFTPQAGNTATTRGEARKIAAMRAAELMTENLQSSVPLVIQGCWPENLQTSMTSAVLANARARTLVNNTPGTISNTWYPVTIGERLSGTQACKTVGGSCDAPAIIINFNPRIDTNQGLGTVRWFYGIDDTPAGGNVDFVSTALHEMVHGLGFSSAMFVSNEDTTIGCPSGPIDHTTGTLLCNQTDIFTSFLVRLNEDDTTSDLDTLATDAEREAAITRPNRLLWNSQQVAESPFNTLSDQGIGLAQMFSPFGLSPGSSVSHFSSSYSELMEPQQDENLRILGLATPLLWDIGWDPRPKNQSPIVPGWYFDPSRNGHGFTIEPIANSDLFFIVFYTYQEDGTPEWYTALSTAENNVLTSTVLNRVTYDFTVDPVGSNTPLVFDTSLERSITIDFNQSATQDASCPDNSVGVSSWQIGDEMADWCIESINNTIGAAPTSDDLGGTWWAGSDDDGWGMSLTFTENNVIVVTLYFFDADGNPRWTLGTQSNFEIGQPITLNMNQFEGYARDGVAPEQLEPTSAGELTLTLNGNTGENQGTMTVNVSYQGIEGGSWMRTNVPTTLFTAPH